MSFPAFSTGHIPTRHSLRAAVRVCRSLGDDPLTTAALRAAYAHLPTEGVFGDSDFMTAERLLQSCGLLFVDGRSLVPQPPLAAVRLLDEDDAVEALLLLVLQATPPDWLPVVAVGGELASEFIPEKDWDTLTGVLPDADRREAILIAAGNRFNSERAAEVGEAGEQAVIAECRRELQASGRTELVSKVYQASRLSDELGYDVVAPTLSGPKRRLEVKTSGRSGPMVEFYLSRNEADVGRRDPSWALVACTLLSGGEVRIEGWCRMAYLESMLPSDQQPLSDGRGRWATVRIRLPRTSLNPGLPPILSR
jgi:hypothetical protein